MLLLLLLLLLGAPAWQGNCSWGTLKQMGVALRPPYVLFAYRPPQEGLAAAKAKGATKESFSI
jgi:hypothetical protein